MNPPDNTPILIYAILILLAIIFTLILVFKSGNEGVIIIHLIILFFAILSLFLSSSFNTKFPFFMPKYLTYVILSLYSLSAILLLCFQNNMKDYVSNTDQQTTVTNINYLSLSLIFNTLVMGSFFMFL